MSLVKGKDGKDLKLIPECWWTNCSVKRTDIPSFAYFALLSFCLYPLHWDANFQAQKLMLLCYFRKLKGERNFALHVTTEQKHLCLPYKRLQKL